MRYTKLQKDVIIIIYIIIIIIIYLFIYFSLLQPLARKEAISKGQKLAWATGEHGAARRNTEAKRKEKHRE